MNTPVVFIVFKRPELTRRVLSAIRAARPRILFVVADGPRSNRPDEAGRCAEVRALVEDGVDWPCELVKIYAAENLGCARRVSSGLGEVFGRVERAIILEDDCFPDPTFFAFCEELLERYRDDERVAQIAGCSFLPDAGQIPASYFFSRYPHCWGWATWRRAWRHYDHSLKAWSDKREDSWKIGPERSRERNVWVGCFDAAQRGEIDTWAYRWTAANWARGVWSVTPGTNLVSNLGFGADATHTVTGQWGNLPALPMRFPLTHPSAVEGDTSADAIIGRRVFEPLGFVQRLVRLSRRILHR